MFGSVEYPSSMTLYLRDQRKVPYTKKFRISQEVKVNTSAGFWGSLGKDGQSIPITGSSNIKPATKPCATSDRSLGQVQIQVFPLDRTRAPIDIRHK